MNNVNLINYDNQAYCFPVNFNVFKVLECFTAHGFLDFSSKDSNIKVDDEVYLYAAAPFKFIFAKCKVEQILSNDEAVDESLFIINEKKVKEKQFYVRLKLIDEYFRKKDKLIYEKLKENGLKQVQSQHRIEDKLRNYINSI